MSEDHPLAHFLLVDDLEENLVSLEALLKREDVMLLKARSGEEALELMLSHDIALALLDVQMPDMDGFELAEFMRGSERSRHIPIIFVTAGSTDTQRRFRGYEAGAVDFLQKPIEADILRSKANIFLELYRQRQQLAVQRDELAAASQALTDAAQKLEAQVAERTADLEEALTRLKEEVTERERAEAALRQSQKMEAVGQLTGGIAHDFNNMLTGVIGSLDVMKRRITANRFEDLDRFMDAATTSAQRAAALTSRLLAFSRRQSLDSRPTDINALVRSLDDLLQRTMSERIDVSIICGNELPLGMVDANQLENAILNLAINARDAMPDGGELTIESGLIDIDAEYVASRPGVVPGRYVTIAVSDTGVGMNRDTLEKVFEPFYTTKPIGQGTGLGLSMVYGFAKQSSGQVHIDSAVGVGTSVTIYLPCADTNIAEPQHADAETIQEGSGQKILVVEDDDSVRLLIGAVLTELGYMTVAIAESEAAVRAFQSGQKFDLMISDVGLPGLNGRQLAEVAREYMPTLPILFVTGYAENAGARAGFLGHNMDMMTKPFQIETLAVKVNRMLG